MSQTFQALKMSKEMWKLFKHSKYPWRCDNLRLFQNLLGPSGLQSPTVDFGSHPVHTYTHTRGYKQANPKSGMRPPWPLQWLIRPCGDDDRLKFVAMFQRIRVLPVCHWQLSVIYFVCNCHWFMSTVLSSVFCRQFWFCRQFSVILSKDCQSVSTYCKW